jgi:U4/U6 small nuclear ribonucleoprotein PRP31
VNTLFAYPVKMSKKSRSACFVDDGYLYSLAQHYIMSLADALLADFDGLSDDGFSDHEESAPQASTSASTSNGNTTGNQDSPFGSMGPPPLPAKMIAGQKRLAAALDGEGDEDDEMEGEEGTLEGGQSAVGFVPEGGVKPADELDVEEVNEIDMTGYEDVSKISKLLSGNRLKVIIAVSQVLATDAPGAELNRQDIDKYSGDPTDMSSSSGGPLAENPEYHLVVSANNMTVEVDNEILLVHKFIRDHYAPRFPELEQLVVDPWTYIAAVQGMGNCDDLTKPSLANIVPAATVMSIAITASTSRGKKLTPSEWKTVENAVEVASQLRDAREKIFAYVESRISAVAPNISAIVGTAITAKLLGLAGGLQAVSRTPACNIMLFGALKKSMATTQFSAAGQQRHTGFIFQSPIVQSAEKSDRGRAQKAVSAKLILAARIDAGKGSRDGSFGRKCLAELTKRIEKMAEPPPNKMTKALPIPQETNRKKRGGKRARKQKEAYAQTEFRKLQNRMEFGKAEAEADMDDETVGLGMIGSSSGRVRSEIVDSKSKGTYSSCHVHT